MSVTTDFLIRLFSTDGTIRRGHMEGISAPSGMPALWIAKDGRGTSSALEHPSFFPLFEELYAIWGNEFPDIAGAG